MQLHFILISLSDSHYIFLSVSFFMRVFSFCLSIILVGNYSFLSIDLFLLPTFLSLYQSHSFLCT